MTSKERALANITKLSNRMYPVISVDFGSGKGMRGVALTAPSRLQFKLEVDSGGQLSMVPVVAPFVQNRPLEMGMPVTIDLNTGYVVACGEGVRPMGVVSGVSVESNSVDVLLENTGTIIRLKIEP